MLAGVLDALGRTIAIDRHTPQRMTGGLPDRIVDDGAAVSRPCQGMNVPMPLRRQPAGRLRHAARHIDFDQSHIAVPRPRHTHFGSAGHVREAPAVGRKGRLRIDAIRLRDNQWPRGAVHDRNR